MPSLRSTSFHGEIVFLGLVRDAARPLSEPVEQFTLGFDGISGDARSGRVRESCERVTDQHQPGTEIANVRQISILSDEELAETAFALRIPRVAPEWVGASIVLRGLPDLTHLPPSSRLTGPDGVTLVVDMADRPTASAGEVIETFQPGVGARYRPAALNRRGVTAWVERPGVLELGQSLQLHIPDQRGWEKMSDVRG